MNKAEPENQGVLAPLKCSDAPPRFDDWLSPARFGLVLCVCIVAWFPEVIFGNQSFVARDFGLFSYPVAYYHRACFWRGEWPLWNPWHNCGIPFLAQFNTLTLYPLSLIYLLFPLKWSLSIFCLLHLYIAGMGMYTLAARWTGNRHAGALAGMTFAFNGLSLNLLMWPSHIATYSWMPWVVWSVEKGWQEGGRKLLWAVALGSLQMLSGGPETILFTWLILLAMWLGQFFSADRPRGIRVVRFLLMAALVAGVCAAQLLPFLDLVAHSQRDENYRTADWSMPGTGWANFFVPLFGCFLTRKGIYFQDQQSWTSSYYCGIGAVLLALIAIVRVRSARVWMLAVLFSAGLLLAVGRKGFVLPALKMLFPALAYMAHPIKFVFPAVFALPLLAGFGIDELQRRAASSSRTLRRLLLAVGVVVGMIIVALVIQSRFHPQDQEVWTVTLGNGLGRLAILSVTVAGLFFMSGEAPRRIRAGLGLGLLLLSWVDINTHAPTQNPTAQRAVFQPRLVQLSPRPGLGQSRAFVLPAASKQLLEGTSGSVEKDFLLFRQSLFLNSNILDDIPTVWGFYSLYLRSDRGIQALLRFPPNQEPSPLLDFLGIAQETSSEDIFKFEPRRTWLPMITAGQRPVFLDPTNTLAAMGSPEFQPREIVYLPPDSTGTITVSTNTLVKILSQRIQPQRAEVEIDAREPSMIVVAQSYYPGWRARIGSEELPIVRANYNFQACQVPAGRNCLILEFRDGRFAAGLAISAVCLLLWLGGWIASGKDERSSATLPAEGKRGVQADAALRRSDRHELQP